MGAEERPSSSQKHQLFRERERPAAEARAGVGSGAGEGRAEQVTRPGYRPAVCPVPVLGAQLPAARPPVEQRMRLRGHSGPPRAPRPAEEPVPLKRRRRHPAAGPEGTPRRTATAALRPD